MYRKQYNNFNKIISEEAEMKYRIAKEPDEVIYQ